MSDRREPKLTRRQRRQLPNQEGQPNTGNTRARRDTHRIKLLTILGGGGLVLGGGLLTAPYIAKTLETYSASQDLESKRQAAGKKYEGRLDLKGQNFLDSYSLTEQMHALRDVNQPLLTKLHRHLGDLLRPDRHPEFEAWVPNINSPLPILENQTTTASVTFNFNRNPEYAYAVLPNGSGIRFQEVGDIAFAISLQRTPAMKASSALAQSLFLAKETLSLALVLGHSRDYHKMLEERKEAVFTDENRQPITDLTTKQAAGRALFDQQMYEEAGPLKSVVDGLPILLLAPIVRDFQRRGLLLNRADKAVIGSYEDAGSVIDRGLNKALDQKVRSLISRYSATTNFIPSIEFLYEVSQGDLLTASMEVHQQTIKPKPARTP